MFTENITDIISLAAVVGAAITLVGYTNRAFMWMHRSTKQAEELKALKEEQELLCMAISACLDGLMQLGANHDIPKAKKDLDAHIRTQAHK